MTQSLYEIGARYLAALEFLTDPESDIDESTFRDTLEGIGGEFQDKALNVAKYISQLEAMAESTGAVAKRQAERAKTMENKADRLRAYLLEQMQITGVIRAQDAEIAISLAKLPPSVKILDESEIPSTFIRTKTTYEPDKKAIKEAGGCPGAVIVPGQFRVSIK